MTTKQVSTKPAAKPLVTDALSGQCDQIRTVQGVAGRRCPLQGTLREISGGIAAARAKLCDHCATSWTDRQLTVRTVTAIEVQTASGEQSVHACGDPDCVVPHPPSHKRPPE